MYEADDLSVFYSIFCSSKLLQTHCTIKQRNGSTRSHVLHWTPGTRKSHLTARTSESLMHSCACMYTHIYTLRSKQIFIWVHRAVASVLFDLSKMLFSDFRGLFEQIRHSTWGTSILLKGALWTYRKLACWSSYLLNDENILQTPNSFTPAHSTLL